MDDHVERRGQAPLRRLFYLGLCRLRGILSPPAPTTVILQAGRSPLRQRRTELDAEFVAATAAAGGPFFFAAKKFESDAEDRCRYGRSRRAILYRHDDCAASIRKSGIEIKNRCTQEGVNGEKHASIPKSGPEIKNHCSRGAILEGFLAAIPKLTP